MPHPLYLTFSDAEGNSQKIGPFAKFYLQGETLREESGGTLVAFHEEHSWHVEGKRFARFDCDGGIQVIVTKVDGKRTQHYGPFRSFSAQDGVTFADHEIFAFADRSIGDWYCHLDATHWAMLVVEPL